MLISLPSVLDGLRPGRLDPSQPTRVLSDPNSQLSFAVYDPLAGTGNALATVDADTGDGEYSPKRIVIETPPGNGAIGRWRYVPAARRAPGVPNEGTWPRIVVLCGIRVILSQEQWDIYKLDRMYDCFIANDFDCPIINKKLIPASGDTHSTSSKRRQHNPAPDGSTNSSSENDSVNNHRKVKRMTIQTEEEKINHSSDASHSHPGASTDGAAPVSWDPREPLVARTHPCQPDAHPNPEQTVPPTASYVDPHSNLASSGKGDRAPSEHPCSPTSRAEYPVTPSLTDGVGISADDNGVIPKGATSANAVPSATKGAHGVELTSPAPNPASASASATAGAGATSANAVPPATQGAHGAKSTEPALNPGSKADGASASATVDEGATSANALNSARTAKAKAKSSKSRTASKADDAPVEATASATMAGAKSVNAPNDARTAKATSSKAKSSKSRAAGQADDAPAGEASVTASADEAVTSTNGIPLAANGRRTRNSRSSKPSLANPGGPSVGGTMSGVEDPSLPHGLRRSTRCKARPSPYPVLVNSKKDTGALPRSNAQRSKCRNDFEEASCASLDTPSETADRASGSTVLDGEGMPEDAVPSSSGSVQSPGPDDPMEDIEETAPAESFQPFEFPDPPVAEPSAGDTHEVPPEFENATSTALNPDVIDLTMEDEGQDNTSSTPTRGSSRRKAEEDPEGAEPLPRKHRKQSATSSHNPVRDRTAVVEERRRQSRQEERAHKARMRRRMTHQGQSSTQTAGYQPNPENAVPNAAPVDPIEREEEERCAQLEESRRKLAELEKDKPLWEAEARRRAQEEAAPDHLSDQQKAERRAAEEKQQRATAAEEQRRQQAAEAAEHSARRKEFEDRLYRERQLWSMDTWTVDKAVKRYRELAAKFDKMKFGPNKDFVNFYIVPWPVFELPATLLPEHVTWQAVELFFSTATKTMTKAGRLAFLNQAHKRFHPDRWRSRGLEKAVGDTEQADVIMTAVNTVSQAVTPMRKLARANSS